MKRDAFLGREKFIDQILNHSVWLFFISDRFLTKYMAWSLFWAI
jgi:hypothetical protein